MKILLVAKKAFEEMRNPIAVLDLAPYLRKCGHEVDVAYLDRLPNKQYDLVGFSVLQAVGNDPIANAVFLKEKFGSVVVGGKWTKKMTAEQRAELARHNIQVHVGPGELLFDNMVDYAGYPPWNPADFDALGDVRYEVMSSRGCPYHCNFCHNTEETINFFPPERTADNIKTLFDKGMSTVFITDDIFTLNATRMEDTYEALRLKGVSVGGRNMFFTHVNFVKDGTIAAMKKFAPYCIQIGIESGDDRMLNLMHKGFTAEKAFERLTLLKSHGINVSALFLVGYPGESRESLENTYRFVQRAKNLLYGVWVSFYQPVPNTVGYEIAKLCMPEFTTPLTNGEISYVDPNVSRELLTEYRNKIMTVLF